MEVKVTSDTPKDELTRLMQESGLNELPVIDAQGRLVGSIAYQALVGALREEATADIQKMVGVSKDERAPAPPVAALLLGAQAAALAGDQPSHRLRRPPASSAPSRARSQNSPRSPCCCRWSQASRATPAHRPWRSPSAASRFARIGPRQWFQLFTKEAIVGLVNGVAIAVTTGVAVLIWSQSMGLAAVISISMVISMVIAGVSGALTPIILSKLGQDPAQSSSIVLTTITDIAGFMSFLGIATALAAYLPTG